MDLKTFRVSPRTARPITETDKDVIRQEARNKFKPAADLAWLVGCGSSIVLSVLGIFFFGAILHETTALPFLAVVFSIIVGVGLGLLAKERDRERTINLCREDIRRSIARLSVNREQEAIRLADRLTSEMTEKLESAPNALKEIKETVSITEKRVKDLEDDLRTKSYGRFWDGVEAVLHHISRVNYLATRIMQDAEAYRKSLQSEQHNFPDFPIHPEDFPDINSIVKQFANIVRVAQSDFQFAMIWEQRRSREEITRELKVLGLGLEGIEMTSSWGLAEMSQNFRNLEELLKERLPR